MRNCLLCLILAALAGCATTQSDQAAFEYRPGGPVRSDPAPKTSVYALYRVADPANQPTCTLCAQVKVYQGCPLGFATGADDKPRAVAGSDSYALVQEGWYRWEDASRLTYHKLTDLRWSFGEPVRSGLECTGQVVAFPFMTAAYAVLFTFSMLIGMPGHL